MTPAQLTALMLQPKDEIKAKAISTLTEDTICRGMLADADGRVCAIGHLWAAARGVPVKAVRDFVAAHGMSTSQARTDLLRKGFLAPRLHIIQDANDKDAPVDYLIRLIENS